MIEPPAGDIVDAGVLQEVMGRAGGLYDVYGRGTPAEIFRARVGPLATSFQQNVLNPLRRAFGMTSISPGNIWGGQTGDWRRYLAQVQQGLQPYGFGYGPTWGQPGGFLGPKQEPTLTQRILAEKGYPMTYYQDREFAYQSTGATPYLLDERPSLDVGPGDYPGYGGYPGYGRYPSYSGGGYSYLPSGYGATGAGLGAIRGTARGRAAARSQGLVNWRI